MHDIVVITWVIDFVKPGIAGMSVLSGKGYTNDTYIMSSDIVTDHFGQGFYTYLTNALDYSQSLVTKQKLVASVATIRVK